MPLSTFSENDFLTESKLDGFLGVLSLRYSGSEVK